MGEKWVRGMDVNILDDSRGGKVLPDIDREMCIKNYNNMRRQHYLHFVTMMTISFSQLFCLL